MSEEEDNPLMDNLMFILVLVIAIVIVLAFVWSQMNGAARWSDFYVKQVATSLELSEPGDKIEIDVHQATKIANRNQQLDFQKIFSFNETENEICVALAPETKTCYNYFNDIKVSSHVIISGSFKDTGKNTLALEISSKTPEVK